MCLSLNPSFPSIYANPIYHSDLPIVISLEVHACAQQQDMMVEIMTEIWKPFLLTPPATEYKTLPSPASLRNKILIKVKYVDPQKAALEAQSAPKEKASSGSASASEEELDTPGPAAPELKQKQKKKSSITPALSAMGVYTRAYHFSLTAPEASLPNRTSSFSQSDHPSTPFPTHIQQFHNLN